MGRVLTLPARMLRFSADRYRFVSSVSIKPINTSNASPAGGHYSQAVMHVPSSQVFVSGLLPITNDGTKLDSEPFDVQATCVLNNLEAILEEAGTSMDNLISCRVYITDLEMWGRFNEMYSERLGEHRPARVVVPVPQLHYGLQLEMEAVAHHSGNPQRAIRLLVPKEAVGGLIGKGGDNVRQDALNSGAFLTIEKVFNQDVLSVRGKKNQVVAGVAAVTARLEELATDGNAKVEIVLPESQVGVILGLGGKVIKGIAEATSCFLEVSTKPLLKSTDRKLRFRGKPSQVREAVRLVVEKLVAWDGQPKDDEVAYGANQQNGTGDADAAVQLTWSTSLESRYVGTVIGEQGRTISMIRNKSGAQVVINTSEKLDDPEAPRSVTITGTKAQNELAMDLLYGVIASYDPTRVSAKSKKTSKKTSEKTSEE
eukprot:CAMPEP_0175131398 /NCGR_PEP_ID=MMETSP0087-20121206/6520_1 /TAXON_ID=136419 /ORGANISM="Unknown Unknown, Strain D1" /LENGTH=426 /DNA_ID=CAMNT_0016413683 /DNA_START=39 /DNA_END=1319 /DNA_ORIENTATION=+